jgi:O-antigen/teichoic acid export membrane protein
MTGTTIAQAIPIAISPILTRIYTPEDFGVFAVYIALASILSIIVTGRYELAIMIPKKDDNAKHIVYLSVVLSFFISLCILVVIYVFNDEIVNLLKNEEIRNWLYFLPITTFLTGIYQSFRYWNNRAKRYKNIARSKVNGSVTVAVSNLSFGFNSSGFYGLIISQFFGQIIGIVNIWPKGFFTFKSYSKIKIYALAKKYKNYPIVDIPASLLNSLSQYGPHLLFLPLFGAATAGYYYLIQRVFMMPISVISTSIAEVFRQEAISQYNKNGDFKKIFLSTLKKLILIAIIPFTLLTIFSQEIFIFAFGSNWAIAGQYAQILAPMFMMKFIVSPLTYALYVRNKLVYDLWGQTLLLSALSLSIVLAYINNDMLLLIKVMSASFSFVYFVYLCISYKLSKGYCSI